jgi:hypothetical protein
MCSRWVAEWTRRSSMYTITLARLLTMVSIRHWKLAGQPSKPMGLVTHWNSPIPGTVKAVYGRALGCKIICQNPAVRLMVLKMALPDQPISPMHSLTSFIKYLSLYDWLVSAQISCTSLTLPSFFIIANMGLLYLLLAG